MPVSRAPRRPRSRPLGPFAFSPAWLALIAAGVAAGAAIGACSSAIPAGYPSEDAGEDEDSSSVVAPLDAGEDVVFQNGFGDDAGPSAIDAAPPPSCPGASVPTTAPTTACVVDDTESCPACAPWGFACTGSSGPQMQGVSPASFCRSMAEDGGALICCTQPACVVTTIAGGCDASAQKRYDCAGGAVPTGTCQWLGSSSPNDYCCD